MTYVRISLMKPLSRRPLEVEKLNRELVQLYRKQEGCISGHLIGAAAGSGEVGRVSFWQSESAADAPATSDQSLSLRSRLHLLVKRGHRIRRSTRASGAPRAIYSILTSMKTRNSCYRLLRPSMLRAE